MHKILVPAAALVFCATTFAATAKEQLAERMLEASGAKKTISDTLDHMNRTISERLIQNPNATPAQKIKLEQAGRRIAEMLQKDMGWEATKPEMIKLYTSTYTEEEMQAAVAFFTSPAGKSFASKQLAVTLASAEIGKKRTALLPAKIQQIMTEEMAKPDAPATTPVTK